MRAEQSNHSPPAVYVRRRAKAQDVAAQPSDVDFTLPAAFVAIAIALSVGAYTFTL